MRNPYSVVLELVLPDEAIAGHYVSCFGGAADGMVVPVIDHGVTYWKSDPYEPRWKYAFAGDPSPELILCCVAGLPSRNP